MHVAVGRPVHTAATRPLKRTVSTAAAAAAAAAVAAPAAVTAAAAAAAARAAGMTVKASEKANLSGVAVVSAETLVRTLMNSGTWPWGSTALPKMAALTGTHVIFVILVILAILEVLEVLVDLENLVSLTILLS